MWRKNPPPSWYPRGPPSPSAFTPMRNPPQNGVQIQDKSVDELRKMLSDKESYDNFFHATDEFRQLDALRNDLRKSNVNLAKQNLSKDAEMAELRNQCTIIRTTELATAQERFSEAQARESAILARSSPGALLQKLQEAAVQADDESEALHRQFLSGGLDLGEFTQRYRQQRMVYHRRALMRLAAQTT